MSWVRSIAARMFIAAMTMAACVCIVVAFSHWQSDDPIKFISYLVVGVLASSLKVTLPGLDATLSVKFCLPCSASLNSACLRL